MHPEGPFPVMDETPAPSGAGPGASQGPRWVGGAALGSGLGVLALGAADLGPWAGLLWVAAAAGAGFTLARGRLGGGERGARALATWVERVAAGEEVAPLAREELGSLAGCADGLGDLVTGRRRLERALGRLMDRLQELPRNIAGAVAEIERGREDTEEAVEETASLMANINSSIRGINAEVDSLSRSTEEASSSILEMGSAVDEVARSAGSLHDSVDASSSSIHEITASIRQVAESADAVQAMAEESAAAMVEMDRAIQEVSQHAGEASQLTEQVSQGAEEGSAAVSATIEGIEQIRQQTLGAKHVLERLAERIAEIGDIVNVIGGINDETNLLSLNAAIIAAQAGEQGKAFAVVANHVKTLAQRTASSTKEIEGLIRAVQEESSNAVVAMGEGMEAVEVGVTRSRNAGDELQRIRRSAYEASSRVAEIARATDEQSRNSKHVAEAAQRTSSMVQQISSAMGEQSRASEAMLHNAEQALDLCRQVHRSTEEQRETGRFITASISSITDMIRSIQQNTESHEGASEAVSEAVARILTIARGSGRRLPEVMAALQELREEAEVLLGRADHEGVAGAAVDGADADLAQPKAPTPSPATTSPA